MHKQKSNRIIVIAQCIDLNQGALPDLNDVVGIVSFTDMLRREFLVFEDFRK